MNEAATNETRDALAGRLEALVRRFQHMAEVREETALAHRQAKLPFPGIAALEASADAYRRCCRELERAAAGEDPPEPGESARKTARKSFSDVLNDNYAGLI